MEHFTPFSALAGGALIGLAAVVLMLFQGRIAGISGIIGGVLSPKSGDVAWRVVFLLGLVGGAGLTGALFGLVPAAPVRSLALVAAAGALVGFGTRLGSGCTSGHGVCGIARLSTRSLLATGLFMTSAAAVVFVTRHVIGG
jgi:uncharacterized membrane protein YedE/YeeE